MSEAKTKACNLTEDEIKVLIMLIGREIDETTLNDSLERMNYLNKRLKTFNEPEAAKEPNPANKIAEASAAPAAPIPASSWGASA